MKKGQRKYRCGSCGAESTHHWLAANRAAGIRCDSCGSRNMELTNDEAKRDARRLQAIRTGDCPRSLIVASSARDEITSKVVG